MRVVAIVAVRTGVVNGFEKWLTPLNPLLTQPALSQHTLGDGADVGRAVDYRRAGGGQRLLLGLRGAGGADDDGAGVAHTSAGRRGGPGDEGDHRLGHLRADVVGGLLLRYAADLADEDDGGRVRVLVEHAQRLHRRGADDRVSANADAGGLADAVRRQLRHRLVDQRTGSRDDADLAGREYVAGHDAHAGLSGGDDPRTVGADDGDA